MTNLKSVKVSAVLAAVLICSTCFAIAGDEQAVDFTLDNLRGEPITLSEALAEGPVILDFWATWCKPCRHALPALQKLANKHADQVTVLTVSIDDPRSRSKIASTMRSLGVKLPVLLDGDKYVASLYRVTSVPATFLIEGDGTIAAVHHGYRDGDMDLLATELDHILSGGTSE
jgi:thiol-disulfide isomerase/thioredoxin